MTGSVLIVALVGCGIIGCGSGAANDGAAAAVDAASSGSGSTGSGAAGGAGVAVIGGGNHDVASVKLSTIATSADGLDVPRDLAFLPARPGELWIVNKGESMVVVAHAGEPGQSAKKFHSEGSMHFFARPAAIAAGANGTFATIHESDTPTQDSMPGDFMGPSLWTSDPAFFDAGEKGHIDMLHNTPNGMGIAWDHDNMYWVFDGQHGSIPRYDFRKDHGPAGEDHSDGIVARYVEGQVARVAGVPSHLELGPDRRTLFVADTGHARVAVLDTQSGARGADLLPNYDGSVQYRMDGAKLTTLIDGAAIGLVRPSGLAIRGETLFVGDYATGIIHAFNLQGAQIDWLDTGLGPNALMGLELDAAGQRILRLTAH